MTRYPIVTVNTVNPDPTDAINAFLWTLQKARELGMSPPTEHLLAEHLFRKDVKIMFYTNSGGIWSLVMNDEAELDEDDMFDLYTELVSRIIKSRRARKAAKVAKEAAQGIVTGTDETLQAAQPEGLEPDPAGDAP